MRRVSKSRGTISSRRKCAYCEEYVDRKLMVSVPKAESKRKPLIDRLGEDFQRKIMNQPQPYICSVHLSKRKRAGSVTSVLPVVEKIRATCSRKNYEQNSLCDNMYGGQSDASDSEISGNFFTSEDDIDIDKDPDFNCFQSNVCPVDKFICSVTKVLPFIKKCYKCLENKKHSNAKSNFQVSGAALIVNLKCPVCDHAWCFSSSETLEEKTNRRGPKVFRINRDLPAATVVSGNFCNNVNALLFTLEMPMLSERSYYQTLKKCVYPTIEEEYAKMEEKVYSMLVDQINQKNFINISGDGQYDSRGYSALYCRYSIMDISTKLIINMAVCRKERSGSSAALEGKGHEIALRGLCEKLEALTMRNDTIYSFTSDRCSSMETLMASKFPLIVHYYDNWHYVRSMVMDIKKRFGQTQFRPVQKWCKKFVAHVYYAITTAKGDGLLAYEILASFFNHIIDQHIDFPAVNGREFTVYHKCGHGPLEARKDDDPQFLDLSNPVDKKAYDLLMDIALTQKRSKDLMKVSPLFSTSEIESFHFLTTTYLPKDKYFSLHSHEVGSKLSAMHWNIRQFERLNGERPVVGKKSVYSKTKKEVVQKKVREAGSFDWRRKLVLLSRGHVSDRTDLNTEMSETDKPEEKKIDALVDMLEEDDDYD